jgi:GAF domain-containing protein
MLPLASDARGAGAVRLNSLQWRPSSAHLPIMSAQFATPKDDPNEAALDQVQQMLREGAARAALLCRLISAAELLAGAGAVSSILVVDDHGLLRNGASPNLPADYLDAIDRLKPDPGVGTCAAAAATGAVVVTPDFRADEKWAELRHLPLALGFVGAWSVPIKAPDGTVIGTFGTYFRDRRLPSARERRGVERLAEVAARVLAAH